MFPHSGPKVGSAHIPPPNLRSLDPVCQAPTAPSEFAAVITQQIAYFRAAPLVRLRFETHRDPDADGLGSLFFLHAAFQRAFEIALPISYVGEPTDARFLDCYPVKKFWMPFTSGQWNAALTDAHARNAPNVKGFGNSEEVSDAVVAWDHHRKIAHAPLHLIDEGFRSAGVPAFYFVEQLFREGGISIDAFCRDNPKVCMLLALGILIDEQANFEKAINLDFSGLSMHGARCLQYLMQNKFFDLADLVAFDITREKQTLEFYAAAITTLESSRGVRLPCGDVVDLHTAWVQGDASNRSYVGACANCLLETLSPSSIVFLFHYVPQGPVPVRSNSMFRVPSERTALNDRLFCSVRKRDAKSGGAKRISAAEVAFVMNGDGSDTTGGFCMNPLVFSGRSFRDASKLSVQLLANTLSRAFREVW